MKIFIFSETPEAESLRDKAKAEGHQAYLRNAQYFRPGDFDGSCDVAYTDSKTIAEAFAAIGKKTEPFPWTAKAVKAAPVETQAAEPKTEAPKKAPTKKK